MLMVEIYSFQQPIEMIKLNAHVGSTESYYMGGHINTFLLALFFRTHLTSILIYRSASN